MDITLFSMTLILFTIIDPLGNISSFLSLVNGIERKRILWVLTREMLIALALMIFFNFVGEYILDILEVQLVTVRLSSAVILFLTAIKIIFPATNSLRANFPSGEPFIIPLAVPLIAGPSLLATIMLFAAQEPSISFMLAAIILAWIAAFVIFASARFLHHYLGNSGLLACEKLMGMILVMLAIQRFMEGVNEFIKLQA